MNYIYSTSYTFCILQLSSIKISAIFVHEEKEPNQLYSVMSPTAETAPLADSKNNTIMKGKANAIRKHALGKMYVNVEFENG